MKLSLAWLNTWIDCHDQTPEAISELLTMSGLEVDGMVSLPVSFENVVIGHVLAAEKHPNADKLKVCQVDIGTKSPLTIVCGAKNVAAGQRVAVAKTGASLPGGIAIKAVALRGIDSQGMICAADELGLAESSNGIMVLSSDAPIGDDFAQWFGLPDTIYDLAITPNRGDCLSLQGVAREVAAFTDKPWSPPELSPAIITGGKRMLSVLKPINAIVMPAALLKALIPL